MKERWLVESLGCFTNWYPRQYEMEIDMDTVHKIEGELYLIKGSMTTIKLIKRIKGAKNDHKTSTHS